MITYAELKENNFDLEIFEIHIGDRALIGLEPCQEGVPQFVKKSAEKVMNTMWGMMHGLGAKERVKKPWDTPESFRSIIGLITPKMFWAGTLAVTMGPGEAIGFNQVEEFGAGYLCGDVGCGGGLERKAWQWLGHQDEGNAVDVSQANACYEALNQEMDLLGASDMATLDERKKYFTNACKACYFTGATLAACLGFGVCQ